MPKNSHKKAPKKPTSRKKATTESQPLTEGANSRRSLQLPPNKRALLLVVTFVVLAVLPSLYFYKKSQDSQAKLDQTKSQNNNGESELKQVVDKVSKHAVLPTGEEPTLATITDINKLKDQPFFANAQTGDKVLVYNQAKRVVLYRPSADRIVEIAPLNVAN